MSAPRRLYCLLALLASQALLPARPPPVPPEGTTLRAAAGPELLIGCAVSSRDLEDPRLVSLILRQFNCLTPDNEMMPSYLVDATGRFTFERGDRVADFARRHRLPLFGHMLVWHHETRDWLFLDQYGQPLPREKALANLERHIRTVAGHYRGQVRAWAVVNEAISDRPEEYLRPTPAQRAIGDDYIAHAFQFAHAADPDAELYYNDYNIEEPDKLEKTLRLLRSLRARGVRVDAVGIQGHWHLDYPDTAIIRTAIRTFHEAGFKVFITELDVDVLPRTTSGADLVSVEEGPNPFPGELPDAMQQRLAGRYREIFEALLAPPGVAMITFWGIDDDHSWLNDFPVRNRTNHALLFDREVRPKPAFFAVIEALTRARVAHEGPVRPERPSAPPPRKPHRRPRRSRAPRSTTPRRSANVRPGQADKKRPERKSSGRERGTKPFTCGSGASPRGPASARRRGAHRSTAPESRHTHTRSSRSQLRP